MRRILFCLFLGLSSGPVSATPEALATAIEALGGRDYEAASEAEAAITDPVAADVVEWIRLRQGYGEMQDYTAFLARNGDWPGLPYLIQMGEQNIPETASPASVIAYFQGQSPRTGWGSLRLAAAFWAVDRRDDAMAEAIRAWTTMSLSRDEHDQFMIDWPLTLRRYHEARLDHLLWQGAEDQAERMYPLVSDGWQRLAEARLRLRDRRPGVDDAVAAVPADLRDTGGLNYDRFVWRLREGLTDSAVSLIRETSTSAEALGRPAEWANQRRILARQFMRDGQFELAYSLAANHFVDPDEDYVDFSDLEWIAGYTALRMGDADLAVSHFLRFQRAVESPISMGRAGYWLGRAYEAQGNSEAAAEAYALGARYQSSFYGQLAAERGGLPTDPAFLGQEAFGDWRQADFVNSSVFHAAGLLLEAGNIPLAERFWTHLTESLSRTEAGQLADMALELNEHHIALMIAKRTAQDGNEIMRAYYPVVPDLLEFDLPVSDRLVHSIARRESEFDPTVISHAGAVGLMQVMPRTGREMASRVGVSFSESRLRDDPAFNATLGAGYLDFLIEEFGPNPVLIAVAYNAGPSRAERWMELFGDPRDSEVDVVDWIESIPFRETRNYVMRVTESMRIYDAMLTGRLPDQSLSDLLQQR
ncbi:lytic transglycosylase domain-containing protein [Nioella nitratireducens]|uniref:lytic transglycosylase domain-containing protein n=1 Tax=Nioella nitratireducens TaxID=1287720 RepID=UPI0008FD3178|nr:lytic transglycosylase domain-containing protein [Nioella nitratireducens]